MRKFVTLVMLLLCLTITIHAQTNVLETKVSMQYKNIEISTIIKDLSNRYHLNFSYSNNIVPEKKRVSIAIKNVMLKDALYDLFQNTDVAFQVIGNQIVFKKGINRNTIAFKKPIENSIEHLEETNKINTPVLYTTDSFRNDLMASANQDFIIDTMPDEIDLSIPMLIEDNYQPSKKDLKRKYKAEKQILKAKFKIIKIEEQSKEHKKLENIQMKYNYVTQKLKQEYLKFLGNSYKADSSLNKNSINLKADSSLLSDTSMSKTIDYLYSPYQITFIGPMGTHGENSKNYVNALSLNIISGNAAGLDGFELGGIANIEHDFAKGLQMAGVANIVKNYASGIQLSGFANIVGDSVKALQAAGFCNVVNGSVTGLQAAGFCNVNNGPMNGLQGSGFININKDSLQGIQTAGFANISGGNVTGIQASGFLNVAKKIKGIQIGIVNIADSIQGIPIGLLSFVKKGGHRVVDVYGTEALNLTVAYKMGVRSFYNVFPIGAQLKANKWRVGMGYGVGTETRISQKIYTNTELISMFIWEEGMTNYNSELNIMNRLSTTFGYKLGNRTSLFIGPAFNVMVSNYQDPSKPTTIGSSIAPYSIYDKTFTGSKDVNLKMWIGFNAGIRF